MEWARWLTDGLEEMEPEIQARVLRNCGRRCAETGVLDWYRRRFQDAGEDLDRFFAETSTPGQVEGRVVEPGREYELIFPRCLCDLCAEGGVRSACICECSRQSVLFVMEDLCPGMPVRVEKIATIREGAPQCRFRILTGA